MNMMKTKNAKIAYGECSVEKLSILESLKS